MKIIAAAPTKIGITARPQKISGWLQTREAPARLRYCTTDSAYPRTRLSNRQITLRRNVCPAAVFECSRAARALGFEFSAPERSASVRAYSLPPLAGAQRCLRLAAVLEVVEGLAFSVAKYYRQPGRQCKLSRKAAILPAEKFDAVQASKPAARDSMVRSHGATKLGKDPSTADRYGNGPSRIRRDRSSYRTSRAVKKLGRRVRSSARRICRS